MSIENCPNCGGAHFGSNKCPFNPAQPCSICGELTVWACSDCQINTGKTVNVCNKSACRDAHEAAAECHAEAKKLRGGPCPI